MINAPFTLPVVVCSCGYADAGVSFANFSGKPYDDGDGWVGGAEAERVIS